MGWEDRSYYRDRNTGPVNPLRWLVAGSVSLGTWFGIHVRVHASMVVFILFTLITRGLGTWTDTLTSMVILFGVVLLHEFGHCWGSWMVGGTPSEIMMHPLGGLAFADAPRRPWANFFTVLCGPLVNVLICVITATAIGIITHSWKAVPWNPLGIRLLVVHDFSRTAYYLWWIFIVSYGILLFNLWPIFPLDGGQMLQSLLWVKFGYYKATLFATRTGMVGAGIFGVLGMMWGQIFIVFLAIWGFMTCLNMYRQLQANGPWGYQDEPDYNHAIPTRRKLNTKALKRAQRMEREEAEEQVRIDVILAKVSAQGMHSLTWGEKRALRKATEHQRQRDAEVSRPRKY